MNFKDLIHGLLHEPDFNKRKYYPDKLAKLGDWESTSYLAKIMNGENEPLALKIECAESLGKQGDPRAVEYLAIAIQHEDVELRRTSLWSLGQIGTENTADLIMQLVNDPEFMIQKWVVKSLGRIHSPRGLGYLDSLVDNYSEQYQPHLHLILKAVLDLIEFADKNNLQNWLHRTYLYYNTHIGKLVRKHCLLLQHEIFSRGFSAKRDFFVNKLDSLPEEDKILRPYIIRNLGYTDFDFILANLSLDEDVIIALSISSNIEYLAGILNNHTQFDSTIISWVLENLDIEYDCSEFLHSPVDDIRFAALNYHSRFGLQLHLLYEAIQNGKRVNYLLNLLQYSPVESMHLINHFGIRGSKTHRQSIIQVIKKIDYEIHDSVLPNILELLSQISQSDRI
ncbi:MAG: HEAT repeat domain-containing protein, partial [Candidatus Heimdallarchaeota archaeon]